MPTGLAGTRPPHGVLRLLARLPLWLYRARLGWLLNGRFLRLHHVGRKTGLPRQVVLEVVSHDPVDDTYVVASGWGERSDWLRNVTKRPHVTIDVGRRRLRVRAERLSAEQAAEEFQAYARRHPLAARVLARVLVGQRFDGSEEALHQLAGTVPLVALRRAKGPPQG